MLSLYAHHYRITGMSVLLGSSITHLLLPSVCLSIRAFVRECDSKIKRLVKSSNLICIGLPIKFHSNCDL